MAPKNTPSGVSLADLTAARAAATRSGVPQALRDSAGKVVGWVDASGSIHPGSAPLDGSQAWEYGSSGSRPNQAITRAGQAANAAQQQRAVAQSPSNSAAAQAQRQADSADSALRNMNAAQVGGPVWVNGQMQIVTGFHSDGTPIFGYQGSKTGKIPDTVIDPVTGQPLGTGVQSAYDALNLGQYGTLGGIQGTDRFVLAKGATDAITGMPANAANYGPPGSGDHSYSANVASNGTSQMTIAQGVQWLANLANQSPQAYDTLVTELKHAGYTGASGEPLTGGGYSETVGVAFAKAAKDLSVQQQVSGSTIGMDEFLQNRMAAVKQAAVQATPLAQRQYTDPGTLMATAKSAAQEALGRVLTPDELAKFEQSFRGQEDTYYNQLDKYNQAKSGAAAIGDNAGTAGFSAVQPDASGQANALVQSPQLGQDRANYAAQNYYQAIAQMFGIK